MKRSSSSTEYNKKAICWEIWELSERNKEDKSIMWIWNNDWRNDIGQDCIRNKRQSAAGEASQDRRSQFTEGDWLL